MQPGIYPGITNADYHSGEGYSKSQLDLVRRSPALVQWAKKAPMSLSDAADIGTAAHMLILEPDQFSQYYADEFIPPRNALKTVDDLREYLDTNGIEYKKSDAKAALEQAALGYDRNAPVLTVLKRKWEASSKVKLTSEQHRSIHEMRDSVMAHPEASALLSLHDGKAEQSVYWIDSDTGLLCRCRPDWMSESHRIVADLKTTDDLNKFHWSVRDYRYDVQDAFYSDGVANALMTPLDSFLFIAVGKKRQMGRYPVAVIELDHNDVAAARDEYKQDLYTIAECERVNEWPGVEIMTVPPRRNY